MLTYHNVYKAYFISDSAFLETNWIIFNVSGFGEKKIIHNMG